MISNQDAIAGKEAMHSEHTPRRHTAVYAETQLQQQAQRLNRRLAVVVNLLDWLASYDGSPELDAIAAKAKEVFDAL